MINISICLSDIPESARKKSDKNGKVYCNLVVDARKEPDNYGNTHSVAISQSKEERERKDKKVYIGGGKEFVFENKNQTRPAYYDATKGDDTSLPF